MDTTAVGLLRVRDTLWLPFAAYGSKDRIVVPILPVLGILGNLAAVVQSRLRMKTIATP